MPLDVRHTYASPMKSNEIQPLYQPDLTALCSQRSISRPVSDSYRPVPSALCPVSLLLLLFPSLDDAEKEAVLCCGRCMPWPLCFVLSR
jgi:hypothetical protein